MDECRAVSDMYFVAALLSYGYKLVRIDKSNPRRQKFFFSLNDDAQVVIGGDAGVFSQHASIDEAEALFLSRSLLLPGKYVDTLKEVRATIHGYMEDVGGGY